MLLRIFLLSVICLAGIVVVSAQAPPVCQDDKPGRNCCGVTRIQDCPDTGCGGDPLLNRKKNKTSAPAAGDVAPLTILQIANFKFPKKKDWHSGNPRDQLEQWGEGRAVQISAFLIHAENYASGNEGTNCNLGHNEYNDFHLVLVDNLTLANKWKIADARADALTGTKKKAAKKTAKRAYKRAEKKSLTAEIGPRLRITSAAIGSETDSDREFKLLQRLAKDFTYVRVTGWAMLDTQHISTPINRLSNWEIHPVTKFEGCTATVAECDTGTGWKKLDEMPNP